MAEDIPSMIYRIVLRQSLHEIINDCVQLKEIKEILKAEDLPLYYVGLEEDLDILRFKSHRLSEKIDYENPTEWGEEVNAIKREWEELWKAIDKKSNIKDLIEKAEEISKQKRTDSGKSCRKLEQALEILKLHQPMDAE
jgi:2,3-bisphosphoglycerate-independent phosphoglycerate mutase